MKGTSGMWVGEEWGRNSERERWRRERHRRKDRWRGRSEIGLLADNIAV